MKEFDYLAASEIDEVVSAISQPGKQVRILSGGTDLIVQLREGRKSTDLVVDVKRIPELNALAFQPGEGLTLGASVPCYRFSQEPQIAVIYPGLVDAISIIGGRQIQGRATVGGNLCNASPAADSIPALIVHGAMCVIAGPKGKRELPVEDFCTGPGQTVLASGEFLVAIQVPAPLPHSGAAYLRFTPRNEMDIAVVGAGAAVVLNAEGTRFESARIALGAVAPTPLFVQDAGAFLAGKDVSPENLLAAARIAQDAAKPISDMRGSAAQRKHLSMILTRRALSTAIDRARGSSQGSRGNGHTNR